MKQELITLLADTNQTVINHINITILDVINAIDGTLAITACVEHANANSEQCSHAGSCALKGRWNIVNTHVANALEKVSLQDMVCPVNEPRTVNG